MTRTYVAKYPCMSTKYAGKTTDKSEIPVLCAIHKNFVDKSLMTYRDIMFIEALKDHNDFEKYELSKDFITITGISPDRINDAKLVEYYLMKKNQIPKDIR